MPESPIELMDLSHAQPLTPGQAAKVRSYIFGLLKTQVPLAHRVVMGDVHWSPTQARLFGLLQEKCIPDLSASFVLRKYARSGLETMSREKLGALVARAA